MALIEYPLDNYDTFCSLVDADAILLLNVPSAQLADWTALLDADKEVLLRQSTTLIRNKITLPYTLEDDLKLATAYLANSSVAVDMTTADGKENVKEKDIVGVVKTVYFSRGQDSNSFPDLVVLLLGQYQITSVGSSIKFARS